LIKSTFGYQDKEKRSWDDSLLKPKSICTYFWLLVISIFVFPLSINFHLLNYFIHNGPFRERYIPSILFFPVNFLLAFIGLLVFIGGLSLSDIGMQIINMPYSMIEIIPVMIISYLIGTLSLAISAALIVIIFHVIRLTIYKIYTKYSKKYSKNEVPDEASKTVNIIKVFKEYFKAKKNKVCPLIEWED